MQIGTHARVLVAAVVLGTAILGLSAGQVDARTKKPTAPADTGVRCAFERAPGHLEFYLPGDTIEFQGHTFRCGADGKWHLVKITPDGQTGPSGGVFTMP